MEALLTVTVSQVNRYIKAVLEEDGKLTDLYVKGEISNFSCHNRSGHFYFSLKDQASAVRAVMFQSDAKELPFLPENGMAVLVRARVGVYERDGVYQLYVSDIQPDGAGALAVAFEQRKAKLAAQGLFDEACKKPLPPRPARVGIVTSGTGAALQDILSVLSRRYPLCTAVVAPALVQGREAAASVARAVRQLDREGGCDVMIVGRGGGSTEDLWCFNEEAVAYAVFGCKTPVISAVGHETDYTICDFVADVRAPTPSAAAELAVPAAEALRRRVQESGARLAGAAKTALRRREEALGRFRDHAALRDLAGRFVKAQERLDFFRESLYNRKCIFIQEKTREIRARAALLDSLSPLRVLDRGYCLTYRGEDAVPSVRALRPGDAMRIRFRDGAADAAVQTIQEDVREGTSDDL